MISYINKYNLSVSGPLTWADCNTCFQVWKLVWKTKRHIHSIKRSISWCPIPWNNFSKSLNQMRTKSPFLENQPHTLCGSSREERVLVLEHHRGSCLSSIPKCLSTCPILFHWTKWFISLITADLALVAGLDGGNAKEKETQPCP